MQVLVADDDDDSRDVLCALLQKEGHEVSSYKNGRLAWNAFEQGRFVLVVSDWVMPELNGLELCRRIRASHRHVYPYIILLTALDGKNNYLEALGAGADDFISKPYDPDELRARVRVAQRIVNLQDQIKRLEGVLPTCMYCKKIRDERNVWVGIEQYITQRTAASFSHGVCPDCYQRVVRPEIDSAR
jgi:DNA-binding response OmpR family regulator